MIRLVAFSFWMGLLGAAHEPVTPSPLWRGDVVKGIGEMVCHPEKLSERSFWQAGIYDAQVQFVWATSPLKKEQRWGRDRIRQEAMTWAQKNSYSGAAGGMCADGRVWLWSAPASEPIQRKKGAVHLPVKALTSHCGSIRISYAAHAGGRSVPIQLMDQIPLKGKAPGVISVECGSLQPTIDGPRLWAMVPHGDGFAKLKNFPATDEPLRKRFLDWVSLVRSNEKLLQLAQHPRLDRAARQLLAASMSLRHDRSQIKRMGRGLKSHGLRLIGENRASIRSPEHLAWLVWNSPRHRDLILDPQAHFLGMAIKDQNVVIVTATIAKGTVARKPSRN